VRNKPSNAALCCATRGCCGCNRTALRLQPQEILAEKNLPDKLFFFSSHLYDKEDEYEFYPGSGLDDALCVSLASRARWPAPLSSPYRPQQYPQRSTRRLQPRARGAATSDSCHRRCQACQLRQLARRTAVAAAAQGRAGEADLVGLREQERGTHAHAHARSLTHTGTRACARAHAGACPIVRPHGVPELDYAAVRNAVGNKYCCNGTGSLQHDALAFRLLPGSHWEQRSVSSARASQWHAQ
jgi:hypothetical protein